MLEFLSLLRTRQAEHHRSGAGYEDSLGDPCRRPLDLMRMEPRILYSGSPIAAELLSADGASPAHAPDQPTGESASILAAATQAAATQAAANQAPVAHGVEVVIDPLDHVVAKYSIGHGSAVVEDRLVGFSLTKDGWAPFIDKQILPALEAGFRRFDLHNPFGIGPDDAVMPFDQYLDAQVETPKLTENFAELWKPITDQGVEVIAYIGSPNFDPVQKALVDDPSAWWDRAISAVQPFIDAGMSVALDSSANMHADSLYVDLAHYLRDHGVRVYVEARPASYATQWFDYPIMLWSDTWDRQAPELHEVQVGRHAWADELTGEVLRMLRPRQDKPLFDDKSLFDAELTRVLELGHSVAIPGHKYALDQREISLETYLNGLGIPALPADIGLTAQDPDGDPLTYSIVSLPEHGTLSFHPLNPAKVTYTPDAYYSGSDAFTFRVSDGVDWSSVAQVDLIIHGFAPPPGDSAPLGHPEPPDPGTLPEAPLANPPQPMHTPLADLVQGQPAPLLWDAIGGPPGHGHASWAAAPEPTHMLAEVLQHNQRSASWPDSVHHVASSPDRASYFSLSAADRAGTLAADHGGLPHHAWSSGTHREDLASGGGPSRAEWLLASHHPDTATHQEPADPPSLVAEIPGLAPLRPAEAAAPHDAAHESPGPLRPTAPVVLPSPSAAAAPPGSELPAAAAPMSDAAPDWIDLLMGVVRRCFEWLGGGR